MKFEIEITEQEGCLRGQFCSEGKGTAIMFSPPFSESNIEEKRHAMDNFYIEAMRLIRGCQFPEHTVRFAMHKDGKSAKFIGYPEEISKNNA